MLGWRRGRSGRLPTSRTPVRRPGGCSSSGWPRTGPARTSWLGLWLPEHGAGARQAPALADAQLERLLERRRPRRLRARLARDQPVAHALELLQRLLVVVVAADVQPVARRAVRAHGLAA